MPPSVYQIILKSLMKTRQKAWKSKICVRSIFDPVDAVLSILYMNFFTCLEDIHRYNIEKLVWLRENNSLWPTVPPRRRNTSDSERTKMKF